MKASKDRLLELVTFVEPGSDDVTYTHAVFAQCFLPIRKLRNDGKRYEVTLTLLWCSDRPDVSGVHNPPRSSLRCDTSVAFGISGKTCCGCSALQAISERDAISRAAT